MWEFLCCGCPGKKLDFCSGSVEWDGEIMFNRPDRDGPGFVKGIVPMMNAKTLHLIGVDWRVIQFGAMMKCLVHNQNACLVCDRVIPSSRTGSNWCICEGCDGFVMGTCIHMFGGELKDHEIVAKATCICIRICLIG